MAKRLIFKVVELAWEGFDTNGASLSSFTLMVSDFLPLKDSILPISGVGTGLEICSFNYNLCGS